MKKLGRYLKTGNIVIIFGFPYTVEREKTNISECAIGYSDMNKKTLGTLLNLEVEYECYESLKHYKASKL